MRTIDVGAGQTFSEIVNAGDTLVVRAGGATAGDTIEAGGDLYSDAEHPDSGTGRHPPQALRARRLARGLALFGDRSGSDLAAVA